jgi:hypothetical protein
MKYSTSVLSALALAVTEVIAFPHALFDLAERSGNVKTLGEITAAIESIKEKRQTTFITPGFDAATQYVSNQGDHAFVPPNFAAGDQRGPCPGLNAMANHNYLPHNGIATIQQFITGTNQVFGMGLDLAAFLAVYGAVIDGDGVQWSIGKALGSS